MNWNGRKAGDRLNVADIGRGVLQTLVDYNRAEWVTRAKRNVQRNN